MRVIKKKRRSPAGYEPLLRRNVKRFYCLEACATSDVGPIAPADVGSILTLGPFLTLEPLHPNRLRHARNLVAVSAHPQGAFVGPTPPEYTLNATRINLYPHTNNSPSLPPSQAAHSKQLWGTNAGRSSGGTKRLRLAGGRSKCAARQNPFPNCVSSTPTHVFNTLTRVSNTLTCVSNTRRTCIGTRTPCAASARLRTGTHPHNTPQLFVPRRGARVAHISALAGVFADCAEGVARRALPRHV